MGGNVIADGESPFVLLAGITVKEGMVDEYLEIAEAADKEVEKTEEGMLFHNFDLIRMISINLFGQKFIAKATTFFFNLIIPLFKNT